MVGNESEETALSYFNFLFTRCIRSLWRRSVGRRRPRIYERPRSSCLQPETSPFHKNNWSFTQTQITTLQNERHPGRPHIPSLTLDRLERLPLFMRRCIHHLSIIIDNTCRLKINKELLLFNYYYFKVKKELDESHSTFLITLSQISRYQVCQFVLLYIRINFHCLHDLLLSYSIPFSCSKRRPLSDIVVWHPEERGKWKRPQTHRGLFFGLYSKATTSDS